MNIVKQIPNIITSLNLLSGLVGVDFALKGDLQMAMYLMIAAAIFDFLDGAAARALKAYSPIGKELDSLSDVVSFGVLPALMLCSQMKMSLFSDSLICYIPLIIAAFSSYRLAKFNLDSRQSDNFLGLPTPACALLCAALCTCISHAPDSFLAIWAASPIFIPLLSIILSILLVSELPMFSLKFHKDDAKSLRIKRLAFAIIVAIAVVFCLITSQNLSLALLISLVCYILKNIVYAIVKI